MRNDTMPRVRDLLIVGGLTAAVVVGSMALLHKPKETLVELVCFDGMDTTIPLSGVDTEISATAFGNGILWSIPTESGIAAVHWQDSSSNCFIQRVATND